MLCLKGQGCHSDEWLSCSHTVKLTTGDMRFLQIKSLFAYLLHLGRLTSKAAATFHFISYSLYAKSRNNKLLLSLFPCLTEFKLAQLWQVESASHKPKQLRCWDSGLKNQPSAAFSTDHLLTCLYLRSVNIMHVIIRKMHLHISNIWLDFISQ